MIVYWAKLVSENQSKISHMIYLLLYKLDVLNISISNWISTIQFILHDSGFLFLANSCPLNTFRYTKIKRKISPYIHTFVSSLP